MQEHYRRKVNTIIYEWSIENTWNYDWTRHTRVPSTNLLAHPRVYCDLIYFGASYKERILASQAFIIIAA